MEEECEEGELSPSVDEIPVERNQTMQPQQPQQRPRPTFRPIDKFLMSSDEESDSPNDDDDDEDGAFAWKRKKPPNAANSGREEEDHPREFLEAWQQQKAKDRRYSESRRSQNENGDSVKNILQSPSRSPRDIRLPGHTPSNSPKMKRKKNNIWGAVVEDQVLEQGMKQSIGLFEKPEDGDERGVESYNFERAKDDTREFAVPELKECSSQEEMFQVCNDANDPFQKLLEAEGLKSKDDEEEDKSSNEDDEKGAAAEEDEEDGETREKRTNRKRSRGDLRKRLNQNRHEKQGIDIKDRLSPKDFDTTMTCDENDDEDRVIEVIQNRLREPKRHLIGNVVSVMGKEFAIKILVMTESIEEEGGMSTADNRRRRTPGGVYMQLIKSDVNMTKEQRKRVFEDDKKLYNKKQKEMRKLKFADRNRWREKNEEEAMKVVENWKGEMKEKEEEERAEDAMDAEKLGGDEAAAAAAAATTTSTSCVDFGDEFCDVDAVKDDVISGFGLGDDSSGSTRDRRRTPSPIEDLF